MARTKAKKRAGTPIPKKKASSPIAKKKALPKTKQAAKAKEVEKPKSSKAEDKKKDKKKSVATRKRGKAEEVKEEGKRSKGGKGRAATKKKREEEEREEEVEEEEEREEEMEEEEEQEKEVSGFFVKCPEVWPEKIMELPDAPDPPIVYHDDYDESQHIRLKRRTCTLDGIPFNDIFGSVSLRISNAPRKPVVRNLMPDFKAAAAVEEEPADAPPPAAADATPAADAPVETAAASQDAATAEKIRIAELEQLNSGLEQRNAQLAQRVAELEKGQAEAQRGQKAPETTQSGDDEELRCKMKELEEKMELERKKSQELEEKMDQQNKRSQEHIKKLIEQNNTVKQEEMEKERENISKRKQFEDQLKDLQEKNDRLQAAKDRADAELELKVKDLNKNRRALSDLMKDEDERLRNEEQLRAANHEAEAALAERMEELRQLKEEVKKLEQSIGKERTKLADAYADFTEKRAAWNKIVKDHEDSKKELAQKMEEEGKKAEQVIADLHARKAEVEGELATTHEMLESLKLDMKNRISGLELRNLALTKEKDAGKAEYDRAAEQLLRLEISISARDHTISEKNGELAKYESVVAQLKASLDEKAKEVDEWQKKEEYHRNSMKELEEKMVNDRKNWEKELEALNGQKVEFEAKLVDREALELGLKDRIAELETGNRKLQEEKEDGKAELARVVAERDQLQVSINARDQKISEKNGELAKYESVVAKLKASLDEKTTECQKKEEDHRNSKKELEEKMVNDRKNSEKELEVLNGQKVELEGKLVDRDVLERGLKDRMADLEKGNLKLQKEKEDGKAELALVMAERDQLKIDSSVRDEQMNVMKEELAKCATVEEGLKNQISELKQTILSMNGQLAKCATVEEGLKKNLIEKTSEFKKKEEDLRLALKESEEKMEEEREKARQAEDAAVKKCGDKMKEEFEGRLATVEVAKRDLDALCTQLAAERDEAKAKMEAAEAGKKRAEIISEGYKEAVRQLGESRDRLECRLMMVQDMMMDWNDDRA